MSTLVLSYERSYRGKITMSTHSNIMKILLFIGLVLCISGFWLNNYKIETFLNKIQIRSNLCIAVSIFFFRWPHLLPILDPEYVAEKIITAVRQNQEVLLIPRFFYVAFALKR